MAALPVAIIIIYLYKKDKDKKPKKYIILSLVVPLLLHGEYDFCIMSNLNVLVYGFIIILLGQIVFTIKQVNNISKINIITNNKPMNFCPKCGTKAIGKYCGNCSFKLK